MLVIYDIKNNLEKGNKYVLIKSIWGQQAYYSFDNENDALRKASESSRVVMKRNEELLEELMRVKQMSIWQFMKYRNK